MIQLRSQFYRAMPGVIALAAVAAVGCHRHTGPDASPPAPRLPVQQVQAPGRSPSQAAPLMPDAVSVADASEPYIESLIAVDSDVRLVLQKIAEMGKMDLIIPGNIRKTISVRYVHVPASVALKDVLTRSGLRLGTGTSAPLPFDTVTVFYRLPANVDSLSAEGIMKRFGVSREIAELIIRSRRPR